MSDRLVADQALAAGQAIEAPNRDVELVMQGDGNLVLYRGAGDRGSPLWASNTSDPGSRAIMQHDGNLVIYGPGGEPRWASGTDGNHGAWLALQDDGNLVIYAQSGVALWASNTQLDRLLPGQTLESGQAIRARNHEFELVIQDDGNLVLYRGIESRDSPLWASNTFSQASRAVMQQDGNFVVCGPDGEPCWATNTHGNPGAWLIVQDDGNLVIYEPGGNPLWAAGTER